mgnify:CR=1 FL=1
MDRYSFIPIPLNLQLFAEGASGGDGGTGAEGAKGVTATAAVSQQTKGAKSNPLANVVYGKQTVATEDASPAAEVKESTAEDRNSKFEELIKGEYKDLFDAKMQDTVQKRLKSSKETVERYEALAPTLEILAKKYGVDVTDIKALNQAIEDDDSYFEEEALEKGISVEQLKEIRKMERENTQLKRQMEEQSRREEAQKTYASWFKQAEETKAIYPSFNLQAELQNPSFARLLQNGIDARTAYEVTHKDQIIHGAMKFATEQAEQKITNKLRANGSRPTENGISSQSATLTKSDVSQLTKADRAEIRRRVANGEKITFG